MACVLRKSRGTEKGGGHGTCRARVRQLNLVLRDFSKPAVPTVWKIALQVNLIVAATCMQLAGKGCIIVSATGRVSRQARWGSLEPKLVAPSMDALTVRDPGLAPDADHAV